VAGVAVPLVMSMMPSARAKAAGAPVEVDISKVEPGMLLTVEWRGKPVWVVNRTPEMLALMAKHDDQLTDPRANSLSNPTIARTPPVRSSRNTWWRSASAPTSVAPHLPQGSRCRRYGR